MQENDFEKQVQQKINELKLKPTEEVWQKVALAITKRKSDRRVLVLVLLLLVIAGSAIFIILDNTGGKNAVDQIKEKNESSIINSIRQPINSDTLHVATKANHSKSIDQTKTGKLSIVTSGLPKTNTTHHQAAFSSSGKKISLSVPEQTTSKNMQGSEIIASGKPGSKKSIHKTTKEKIAIAVTNATPEDAEHENVAAVTEKANIAEINNSATGINSQKQVADTAGTNKFSGKKGAADTTAEAVKINEPKTSPVKKLNESAKKYPWQFGLHFSVGASATQNGYLGVIGSGSNDESKSFAVADPTQTNGGSVTNPVNSFVASKPVKGLAFILGTFVQKDISPKVNLVAGLNYKTYTSSLMIGRKVDSLSYLGSAPYFFRYGSTAKYKNHFHFIELPVAISYRITKQKSVPLYLNAGISVSRLISTNALQFDTASGTYYKANQLFNKTQFGISTGLLVGLSRTGKNPLLVGPGINFSLSNMANAGLYDNRRYSYFGIMLQKTIGKK